MSCIVDSDCTSNAACVLFGTELRCVCDSGFVESLDFNVEEFSCFKETAIGRSFHFIVVFCAIYILVFLGFWSRLKLIGFQVVPLALVVIVFVGALIKGANVDENFIGQDRKITFLLGAVFPLASFSPQIYAYIQLTTLYEASNLPDQTRARMMNVASRALLTPIASLFAFWFLAANTKPDSDAANGKIRAALVTMAIDQALAVVANIFVSKRIEQDLTENASEDPRIKKLLVKRYHRSDLLGVIMTVFFIPGAVKEDILEVWLLFFITLTMKALIHSIVDIIENIDLQKLSELQLQPDAANQKEMEVEKGEPLKKDAEDEESDSSEEEEEEEEKDKAVEN